MMNSNVIALGTTCTYMDSHWVANVRSLAMSLTLIAIFFFLDSINQRLSSSINLNDFECMIAVEILLVDSTHTEPTQGSV